MGYYVEVPGPMKSKAKTIQEIFNARAISQAEAEQLVKDLQKAVICVAENDMFDAAAFCYSSEEFKRFTHPNDPRPKTWLVIDDRRMIEEVTGFKSS